jgi:acyl-CoA synthetase (AMP-forming)/AMP-acid ligase II
MWRIRNVELQRRVRPTTEFPMNIVEPILFQARHDPPAPAMCAPGTALGIVSYARLARFIHSVGHRAMRLGVAPGQVVAIHVKDHIFHAALALGFMHVGIVTVSIGATLPPGPAGRRHPHRRA